MFFHLFKYELFCSMRNIQAMFWMLAFPIVLGTFFYMAFGNLYESVELFQAIPIAVVYDDDIKNQTFSETIDALSSGDDALFSIDNSAKDKTSALSLLENGDVKAVILVGEDISLSVKSESTETSIVKFFLDQYKINEKIITDTINNDPTKLDDVIDAMNISESFITERSLTDGNRDPYVQYFYNLLAMSTLFGSMAGLSVVVRTQGNLSDIGARRCVSPENKLVSITAGLLAMTLVNFICSTISLGYLLFVLKINFGAPLLPLLGIIAIASLTGVSMGFFVGSFGTMSENIKNSILTGVSMILCFFSGLMVGNMYGYVQLYAPWLNKISPAALITDSFYSLNIYDTYDRLIGNLATLLLISIVFIIGGFLLTRRRKYASL